MKYQAVQQHHPSVMIGCFKFELPLAEYRPITQLAIVMGIIKSQKKEILLEVCRACVSFHCYPDSVLYFILYFQIINLCWFVWNVITL